MCKHRYIWDAWLESAGLVSSTVHSLLRLTDWHSLSCLFTSSQSGLLVKTAPFTFRGSVAHHVVSFAHAPHVNMTPVAWQPDQWHSDPPFWAEQQDLAVFTLISHYGTVCTHLKRKQLGCTEFQHPAVVQDVTVRSHVDAAISVWFAVVRDLTGGFTSFLRGQLEESACFHGDKPAAAEVLHDSTWCHSLMGTC